MSATLNDLYIYIYNKLNEIKYSDLGNLNDDKQEFFVLFLQLLCKDKITLKVIVKRKGKNKI